MQGQAPLFSEGDLPDPRHREALQILWSLGEWPRDYEADVTLLRRLATLYPKVDLASEALSWLSWFVDKHRAKHPRAAVAHRSRFTNWCAKASLWAEQKEIRGGIRHRRPGTMEEHGEGNRVVTGW